MDRPLVVTGLGPLCAAGAGVEGLLASLATGRVPVTRYEPETDGVPAAPFALYVVESQTRDRCLREAERRDLPDDPELRLALAALRLALLDACITAENDASGDGARILSRAALVLSWEAPGLDRLQRAIVDELRAPPATGDGANASGRDERAVLRAFYERHREAFYGTQSFLHLHLVARALELHGPTLFVNNACASGLYALEAAASFLREGRADIALVAAAECPRFPTKMMWFDDLGLYARDGVVRPFDRDRSGVVFGEAGAALVLETAAHAESRGARVRCEYLGAGLAQEAWKVAVPDLSSTWYADAAREACARAGVSPEEIDVINVHGAATTLSDLYEARGLQAVWGDGFRSPELVALKPFFGHALGASALLEVIALIASLDAGTLPATPGFVTPDPKLGVAPRRVAGSTTCRTALKMSNGFAGFNAGAVFRRPMRDDGSSRAPSTTAT